MSEPDGARNQEQIAASHEIDGVRKEKERLTAASLNRRSYGSWMQQLSERWFPKKIAKRAFILHDWYIFVLYSSSGSCLLEFNSSGSCIRFILFSL